MSTMIEMLVKVIKCEVEQNGFCYARWPMFPTADYSDFNDEMKKAHLTYILPWADDCVGNFVATGDDKPDAELHKYAAEVMKKQGEPIKLALAVQIAMQVEQDGACLMAAVIMSENPEFQLEHIRRILTGLKYHALVPSTGKTVLIGAYTDATAFANKFNKYGGRRKEDDTYVD